MFNVCRQLISDVYMQEERFEDSKNVWDHEDDAFAFTLWHDRDTITSLLKLARETDQEKGQDILFDQVMNDIAAAFLHLVREQVMPEDLLIDRVSSLVLIYVYHAVSTDLVQEVLGNIISDPDSKIDMHA